MKPKTISPNERALAKLLREYLMPLNPKLRSENVQVEPMAAFLASRGVLAVSAKTLPGQTQLHRAYLRRHARGKP